MKPTIQESTEIEIRTENDVAVELSDLVTIPHDRLRLVKGVNVRVVSADNQDDNELIANIEATGAVLQNLIVKPSDTEPDCFDICAGGRRYSSVAVLIKQGAFSADMPMPCRVLLTGNSTVVSLSENLKAPMHAADEFMAYQKIAEEGVTAADISTSFAVTEYRVRQLLKLAGVHETIIKAFRADKIDLSAVMAFTLADTKKQQLAVFKELGGHCPAHRVRDLITKNGVKANSRLAVFVGLKAYKAAGGALITDLFDANQYLTDGDLLSQMANDKLVKSAVQLKRREGWASVEICTDAYLNLHEYHRMEKQPVGVPDEVCLERDTLTAELAALDDHNGEWSDEHEERYRVLTESIDTLESTIDGYRQYSEEDKARAFCVMGINARGKKIIERGLMTRAQVNQRKRTEQMEAGNKDSDDREGEGGLVSAMPTSLLGELGQHRQLIGMVHLAKTPELAQDLLWYRLISQVLGQRRWEESGIDAVFNSRVPTLNDARATEEWDTLRGQLVTEWLDIEEPAKRLKAFQALTPKQQQALMTFCVAACFTVGVYSDDSKVSEVVMSTLQPEYQSYWRPSGEGFFKRLQQSVLIGLGRRLFGDDWATEHEKSKKRDVVAWLDSFFNERSDQPMSADNKRIFETWLPDGFNAPDTQ